MFVQFLFTSCQHNSQFIYNQKVTSVYDGDTFNILNDRYRLYGIDTPEIKDQNHRKNDGLKYTYAIQARSLLKVLIENQNINIEKISLDKYNRIVSKAYYNNQDISKEMLKNGLAIIKYISIDVKSPFYTSDFNYYSELKETMFNAMKEKRGFWSVFKNLDEVENALYK
ncbi:thermonuclease family protein [Mesomycoplasma lagogenitalium]|uniref:Thermonuclease family protein n=1 Tax=Mesomycoplasma lagogenitalium TaxID=171286 RepID=A0ABY8LU10_9BACT|nr:thermonuclease family protein [Mesomycoplasma lagogenitalium]WGI36729.1 thermonuclease family protein [Mesomycoplasma lagogenitalium]